jgi:hypothetical protein
MAIPVSEGTITWRSARKRCFTSASRISMGLSEDIQKGYWQSSKGGLRCVTMVPKVFSFSTVISAIVDCCTSTILTVTRYGC